MNIQKLSFFDGYGEPLNLLFDNEQQLWQGTYYFEELSVSLFDTVNLIFAELVNDVANYPNLMSNDEVTFELSSDVFFLYKIKYDNNSNLHYIEKQDSVSVTYEELLANTRMPMQINVAFNPIDEIPVEATLVGKLNGVVFLELKLYGVGIIEDVRFNNWLINFGIKFHKNDAQLLENYELEEANPDWKLINAKRKELIVSKEEIIPYIGSYRGLVNIMKIFGYSDIVDIKEYLVKKNINNPEYSDYTLFSISELLKYGIADVYDSNLNMVVSDTEEMHKIYQKSGFLALAYKFTDVSGDYDDMGLPIVEMTSDDNPDEVFHKLYKLKSVLEEKYLPTNFVIRDIIGEYVYFNNIIIKIWTDDTKITNFQNNQNLRIDIEPKMNYGIVNLKEFHIKHFENGLDIPLESVNDTGIDFLAKIDNQKWTSDENLKLSEVIDKFYNKMIKNGLSEIGTYKTDVNDMSKYIGCPVVFRVKFEDLSVSDFSDVILDDLGDYYTSENIDKLNIYEIEWIIKLRDGGYEFNIRGSVDDYMFLSHFLPKVGTYDVQVIGYDLMGNASNRWETSITVIYENNPKMYSVVKLTDKSTDLLMDLINVDINDLKESSISNYYVNGINVFDDVSDPLIDRYNLYWYNFYNYKNNYDIYNKNTHQYESFNNSKNKYKDSLGMYDSYNVSFFKDVMLSDLEYMKFDTFNFRDRYILNWWFKNPIAGEELVFNRNIRYKIPAFTDYANLVDILNNETDNLVSNYDFYLDESDVIKATAKDSYDKMMFIDYGSLLSNGIVLHYMGRINEYDSTINDYYRMFNGNVYNVTHSDRFFQNDLYFNGLNSYIKTIIGGEFDNMSIFMSLGFTDNYDDGEYVLLYSYNDEYSLKIYFEVSGGVMTNDGIQVLINDVNISTGESITFDNNFHNLFFVFTDNNCKIYYGATVKYDGNSENIDYNNFKKVIIGNNDLMYLYDTIGFKGNMYGFTIWNRALTIEEIDLIDGAYIQENGGGDRVILPKLLNNTEHIETSEFNFSYPYIFKESYLDKLSNIFPNFKKEMLMVDAPFNDIVTGKVNDIEYWEDLNYVYNDGSVIYGNIPSLFLDDYFDKNQLKLYSDGYVMLKYIPNFFIVSNIPSKYNYVWILYDEIKKEEIIRVKNVPFLMWTFTYESIYSVSVNIVDSNNNEHYKIKKNFVKVVGHDMYKNYIESELNLKHK